MSKKYSKNNVEELFRKLDKKLEEQVEIIAIGGTALALTNQRNYSNDIDFCYINCKFPTDFAESAVKAGKEVDIDSDNIEMFNGFEMTFLEMPKFSERAIPYEGLHLKNIKLKTMHPLDRVLSKIYRGNARDIEDVELLIKHNVVNLDELKVRFVEVAKSQKDRAVRTEFMDKYTMFIQYHTP